MRDKAFIFDEMRKVRRTLGVRDAAPWLEMAIAVGLVLVLTVASMIR